MSNIRKRKESCDHSTELPEANSRFWRSEVGNRLIQERGKKKVSGKMTVLFLTVFIGFEWSQVKGDAPQKQHSKEQSLPSHITTWETSSLKVNLCCFAAPVRHVDIEQVENSFTCRSEGIYPEPQLTWSTRPPSNETLQIQTSVKETEQQLFEISSTLTLSDRDTVLICSLSTRSGRRSSVWYQPSTLNLLYGTEPLLVSPHCCIFISAPTDNSHLMREHVQKVRAWNHIVTTVMLFDPFSFQLPSTCHRVEQQQSTALLQTPNPRHTCCGNSTTVRSSWTRPGSTAPPGSQSSGGSRWRMCQRQAASRWATYLQITRERSPVNSVVKRRRISPTATWR